MRQTFDATHLRELHRHMFQDVYEWAGELRTVGISKDGESFVPPLNISQPLAYLKTRIEETKRLSGLDGEALVQEVAFLYDYANYAPVP